MSSQPTSEETHMSLGDHLEDLRGCFVQSLILLGISVAISAFFFHQVVDFLTGPIYQAFSNADVEPQLVSGLLTTFFSIVKAVFVAALILVFPFIVKQVWKFVSPGLKSKEVKALRPVFFFGAIFFAFGAAFAYSLVTPIGMSWLLNLNKELQITSLISISESIDFVINMMVVFGIAFETPLVIMGLIRADIVDINSLKKARRYVIMAAFVLGALFTPPDIITQLILGCALVGLYELGILLGRFGFKNKNSSTQQ